MPRQIKGYPTPEQIEEMVNAYKKSGEAGIGEVLQKRAEEAKAQNQSYKEKYPPGLFDGIVPPSREAMEEPTSKPNTSPEKTS